MKKWSIIGKSIKGEAVSIKVIIKVILENRGIKTKKEIDEFLNPKLKNITPDFVGIDKKQLKIALNRIQKAIEKKEKIIVFGDYDVDGICGTAILWETINSLGGNVLPYIPHRIDEGYGLSIRGIENLMNVIPDSIRNPGSAEILKQVQNDNEKKVKLIITVDNGIVASDAVDFANKNGIDVIITDHHVSSKKLPKAFAIVHTTKLCGTGVAWLLSQEIKRQNAKGKSTIQNSKIEIPNDHLALVALATVADLVPLTFANRTLLKFGLEKLKETKRIGLLSLFKEAGINLWQIGVYEIGHMIAPRLNATGRLESAIDSLRLLCTNNREKAKALAFKIANINKERQMVTEETVLHAITKVKTQKSKLKSLIVVSHETYQPGVIGLVAGRLVEEFYRPSIVVSVGKTHSKASARSVSGFNIIEFLRSASHLLVDVGGHPMAAGFTVETAKLELFSKLLLERSETEISQDLLTRSLRIDCEIPLEIINQELYDEMQKLSPFGMANPEPTFVSKNVVIEDIRLVGQEGKHVKFRFSCQPELDSGSHFVRDSGFSTRMTNEIPKQVRNDKGVVIDGIGFGLGERSAEFKIGEAIDIVYTIDENIWNGNKNLQLKIKDIQKSKTSRISQVS